MSTTQLTREQLIKKKEQLERSLNEVMKTLDHLDRIAYKGKFEKAVQLREETVDVAMQALEHAFDFMEDAFGSGEEMVVFVTELTVSGETAAFLSENECEKYDRYHRELLIGTTKQQILSEQRR